MIRATTKKQVLRCAQDDNKLIARSCSNENLIVDVMAIRADFESVFRKFSCFLPRFRMYDCLHSIAQGERYGQHT